MVNRVIRVDQIQIPPGESQQYDPSEVEKIKASIKEDGPPVPIVVREDGGSYFVEHGFKTFQAVKEQGQEEILCIVFKSKAGSSDNNHDFFERFDAGSLVRGFEDDATGKAEPDEEERRAKAEKFKQKIERDREEQRRKQEEASPPEEDWLPPIDEELYKEQLEEDARQIQEEWDNTIVYDPGSGKKKRLSYCEKKYGRKIADRMYQAKQVRSSQLDKATYAEIKKIHAKGVVGEGHVAPIQAGEGKAKSKEQFIKIPFDLLDNEKFRRAYAGKLAVYLWLQRHIIRKKIKADKLHLHEDYYRKDLLACSVAVRKLAKDLGVSANTIRRHLQELESDGCIKIEEVKAEQAWDNQKHHVFILGTRNGKDGRYFIQDAYQGAEETA